MTNPGFIYVMINPSLEGMVKIGKSSRDPKLRAIELSSATGVPTPFIVAYQIFVNDTNHIEKLLHTFFEEKNYKISDNREFFSAPLSEVIEIMTTFKSEVKVEDSTSAEKDPVRRQDNNDKTISDMLKSLEKEAFRYENGLNGCLQDYREAINIYKKASKLGSSISYYRLGEIYRDEYNSTGLKNYQLAIENFKNGVQSGSSQSYAGLAMIYLQQGHLENMSKCWDKFIEMEQDRYTRGDKGYWFFSKLNELDINFQNRPDLSIIKDDIIYTLEKTLESFGNDGDQKDINFIMKKIELINNSL